MLGARPAQVLRAGRRGQGADRARGGAPLRDHCRNPLRTAAGRALPPPLPKTEAFVVDRAQWISFPVLFSVSRFKADHPATSGLLQQDHRVNMAC